MPRFSNAIISVLKRSMLGRLPQCSFTAEDVKKIAAETGLEPKVVSHWAETLRWRFSSAAPGDLDVFLRAGCGDEQVT